MFKIVEGVVPAGSVGRIDLFVSRDEKGGEVTARWDRVGIRTGSSHRVRRVETLGGPVAAVYLQALAAAREANVPLCIIDGNRLFPKAQRLREESSREA